MYYMIDITRHDETATGINVYSKVYAYELFHKLFNIACDTSENVKNVTLWQVDPGVNVEILESIDF